MAKSFEGKWAVLWGGQLTIEDLKRLLHPQEHWRKKADAESDHDCDGLVGDEMASEDEGAEDAKDGNEVLLD